MTELDRNEKKLADFTKALEASSNEKNLADFINALEKLSKDVESLKINDVLSYFLIMRKFFKNYVKENHKNYTSDSHLYIKNDESEKITNFLNSMSDIFDKSKSKGCIHDMTVLDGEGLKKIVDFQIEQINDIEKIQEILNEKFQVQNQKIKRLLNEIGIEK